MKGFTIKLPKATKNELKRRNLKEADN